MPTPDWIVSKVNLSADALRAGWRNVTYPLHVQGKNLSDDGRPFAWSVPMPSPDAPARADRYDFSKAEMDDVTRVALVEAGILVPMPQRDPDQLPYDLTDALKGQPNALAFVRAAMESSRVVPGLTMDTRAGSYLAGVLDALLFAGKLHPEDADAIARQYGLVR